jgi:hypothetical protein
MSEVEKLINKEDYEVIAELEGMSVQEAKLEYSERQKLPATAFCGPHKSYPSHDATYVRNGLTKLSQFGSKLNPKVKARIEECLKSRAKRFGVEVLETKVNRLPLINWYLQECGLKTIQETAKPKVVYLDPQTINFSESFKDDKNEKLHKRADKFVDMYKKGSTDVPPITVYKLPNGKYEIHDGHARVAAFRKLGIKKIPAIVIKKGSGTAKGSSSSSSSDSSSSSSSSDSSGTGYKAAKIIVNKKDKPSGSSSSSSDSSKSSSKPQGTIATSHLSAGSSSSKSSDSSKSSKSSDSSSSSSKSSS